MDLEIVIGLATFLQEAIEEYSEKLTTQKEEFTQIANIGSLIPHGQSVYLETAKEIGRASELVNKITTGLGNAVPGSLVTIADVDESERGFLRAVGLYRLKHIKLRLDDFVRHDPSGKRYSDAANTALEYIERALTTGETFSGLKQQLLIE